MNDEGNNDDAPLRMVVNAARLSSRALLHDPRELAGQLVGRLARIDELEEIRALVRRARAWRCDGGWWCPAYTAGLTSATSRTRLVLTGHTGFVTSVAFSPDGTKIVSGSWDRKVRVWDAESGQPVHEEPLTGHTDLVHSVAFSPDGTKIVSKSHHETIIWDATKGERIDGGSDHDLTATAAKGVGELVLSDSGTRVVHPRGVGFTFDGALSQEQRFGDCAVGNVGSQVVTLRLSTMDIMYT